MSIKDHTEYIQEFMEKYSIKIWEYNNLLSEVLKSNSTNELHVSPNTLKAILISWTSCAWKDSIAKEIYKRMHTNNIPITLVIRDTDRPKREWEKEGVEYNFYTNRPKDKQYRYEEKVTGKNGITYQYWYPALGEIKETILSLPWQAMKEVVNALRDKSITPYWYFIIPWWASEFLTRYIKRDDKNIQEIELEGRLEQWINDLKRYLSLPENIKKYTKVLQNTDNDEWPIEILEKIIKEVFNLSYQKIN